MDIPSRSPVSELKEYHSLKSSRVEEVGDSAAGVQLLAMAVCTGIGFSSTVRPMAVDSVLRKVVMPLSRNRFSLLSDACLYLWSSRARIDQGLLRGLHTRSELHGGSSVGRQGGRRLMTRVANYGRTNQPQSEPISPLWYWLINQLFSGANSALQFLWEQPEQLQHIEWPSRHTVVRMAMLTLIVVTCLIVLLATIDSTMSYVLASLLRRVP